MEIAKNPQKRLAEISDQIRQDREVPPVSVREFLSWFGAKRRGSWIVESIRRALESENLATTPDFEAAFIDSAIMFVRAVEQEVQPVSILSPSESLSGDQGGVGLPSLTTDPAYADPTYRISKLGAANHAPTYVAPDTSLKEAITIMLSYDFSQLPVMTSERDVKGMVSWYSIGTRLSLGLLKKDAVVRDAMDPHQEITADASIFQAIPIIIQHQYVLVRGSDRRISGIVTATDLSLQFQQLAEPFLLLGEIENHIRRIISAKFTTSELAQARDPSDSARNVDSAADLTFGEYIALLQKDDRWRKLGLAIDRAEFCKQLDMVRTIRNDVMHFDPDGIPPEDVGRLRGFARFLQRLQEVGAS